MKNALVVSMMFSITVIAYAQQEPQAQPQQPPAREQPQAQAQDSALTLRGCLTKGSAAQQYVVADEASGQNVPFAGPAKLDSYVNQVVEIRGQIVEREGKRAFLPESVKQISSSCAATQPEK
jgi:hypothetical protein